jgi:hypothetical protein
MMTCVVIPSRGPRADQPRRPLKSRRVSSEEIPEPGQVWTECYPPDFDHGGEPLLGRDDESWPEALTGVAFLGAECALDGRVVLVVATVVGGFVEVTGQFVRQGEVLDDSLSNALRGAELHVPVDRNASRLLGLDVELDERPVQLDWKAAARRIEVDLLSTIHRMASSDEAGHG